jgi:hypothetical protein
VTGIFRHISDIIDKTTAEVNGYGCLKRKRRAQSASFTNTNARIANRQLTLLALYLYPPAIAVVNEYAQNAETCFVDFGAIAELIDQIVAVCF